MAPHDGFVGIVQVVGLEKGAQTVGGDVEHPFDHAVALRVAQRSTLVLVAQQQPQRPQQDRLSGARLTRDDVQAGIEFDFERIDEDVVADRQTA